MNNLGLVGLLSLGLCIGVDAQSKNNLKNNDIFNIPKVPSFYREYEADVPFPLSSDGKIYWQSRNYLVDKDMIREIRGECDLNVKFLFLGVEKIYVGFITRMNEHKKTIETIIYNNGPDVPRLSSHDSLIAKQEHVDISRVKEISHEFADYKSKFLVNMEDLSVTTIKNNAVSFQEAYFLVPKETGTDTTMTVRYAGKDYLINTFDRKEDSENFIYIDLTIPDPDNPGERKNIVDRINWLKIFYDTEKVPYKLVADIKSPLGSAEIEAVYERK